MQLSLPKFGFTKNSLVGLDIGSSTVKVVELAMKGGRGFELKNLGIAPLPSEAIVQGVFLNSSAIADSIREAVDQAGISNKEVAAAVAGHSVIVKKVSLPSMTRDELEDQIQWEAEQYIPFDVNEVNLDFQILESENSEGQMDVLLVAAKKDLIDDYYQVISEAGLTSACVDVAAFAVENAFEANYDVGPDEIIGLVNVGAQVVNISIVQNGFRRSLATSRRAAISTPKRSRSRSLSASTKPKRSKWAASETSRTRTSCRKKSSRPFAR